MHACLEPGENQKLLKILVERSSGKFLATFFFFFSPSFQRFGWLRHTPTWVEHLHVSPVSTHADGDVTKDKSILAAAQFPLSWTFLTTQELQSGLCRQQTHVKGLKIWQVNPFYLVVSDSTVVLPSSPPAVWRDVQVFGICSQTWDYCCFSCFGKHQVRYSLNKRNCNFPYLLTELYHLSDLHCQSQ